MASNNKTRIVDNPASGLAQMATLSMLERYDQQQLSQEPQRNPHYSRWEGQGLVMPDGNAGVQGWLQGIGLTNPEDSQIRDKAVSVELLATLQPLEAIVLDDVMKPIDKLFVKRCEGIVFGGRSLRNSGNFVGNSVTVHLNAVPLTVHYVLFAVTHANSRISQATQTQAFIRQGNPKQEMRTSYTVSVANQSPRQSTLIGVLTRKSTSWTFKSLGVTISATAIDLVARSQETIAYLSRSPCISPLVRRITVHVLRARNLAAKDSGGFFSRKGTSDPYYMISFNKKSFTSKHVSKTLNPTWHDPPFELGQLIESEHKALKITLFDYDAVSKDEFMGTVRIPAAALFNSGPGLHYLTFQLGPSKQKQYQHEAVSGEIFLEVNVNEASISPTVPICT